jgi:hypothetical protein
LENWWGQIGRGQQEEFVEEEANSRMERDEMRMRIKKQKIWVK